MAKVKKAASRKKAKYKSPFEPLEDVIEAAEECKRLIEKGIITLEIRYGSNVHFRIDEEKYRLLKKTHAEDKRFRMLLGDEVTKGLISALTGDITDSFPPPRVFNVDADPYKREAETIKEKVGGVLCDERLRSWDQIKSAAKSPVLESIDWEINVKKAERATGAIKNIPHAIVRFWIRKTEEKPKSLGLPELRFLFRGPLKRGEEQSYTVDMHEGDITNLISDLSKILDTLRSTSTQD